MKCPICEVELQMSERQGIEIDYCPKCRGIWLDRGELDKIVEKSSNSNPVTERRQEMPTNDKRNYFNQQEEDEHDSNQENNFGKKRKKEGFLGDLFDF